MKWLDFKEELQNFHIKIIKKDLITQRIVAYIVFLTCVFDGYIIYHQYPNNSIAQVLTTGALITAFLVTMASIFSLKLELKFSYEYLNNIKKMQDQVELDRFKTS